MVSRDYLAATRPLIEHTIRRQLRQAEHVVDVFALTGHLDTAKDQIEHAVRDEQRRAIRHALRVGGRVELAVTRPMVAPLDRLYDAGKREAAAELDRLGVTPRRRYATDPHLPRHPRLDELVARLERRLGGLGIRVTNEHTILLALGADGPVGEALARALLNVLGARSIAAGLVSTALFAGMGDTFEQNQDLIGGWERSAVLDAGTCAPCEAGDGTQYATWEDAQDDMPNGGPAVDCDGEDRCRCRLVPTGPS